MLDYTVIESKKRSAKNVFALEKEALSSGQSKKAAAYAQMLWDVCDYIVAHSPDRDERKRYRELKTKSTELLKQGKPANNSDNNNNDKDAMVFSVEQRPATRFSDVVGLDDVKQAFNRKAIYPRCDPELAKNYGITYGGLLILYGPPGTGKTLLVRALAGELGSDLFLVKGSDFRSQYVGQSEKAIKSLFDQANKCQNAVIFIDEGDTVFSHRGQADYKTTELNQWLQELEGFNGKPKILLVIACNYPWDIDNAIINRGQLIYVPLPSKDDRKAILDKNIPQSQRASDVNLDELSEITEQYCGRSLAMACEYARGMAYENAYKQKHGIVSTDDNCGVMISQRTLIEALKKFKPNLNADHMRRYEEMSCKQ